MKISIIVAIYNRRDELFELLNSFSHQTYKDFEVIIVDDGSSINLLPTVEIFRSMFNIQYFKKENTGPGLSRNYGAHRAEGEWLVFLDSDVIVEKDYVEQVLKNIEEYPTDAFGGADKAHKGFNLLQKAISYSMTSVFTTGGIRGRKKAVGKFQPRSFNMGVKKSVFLEIGGFSDMRIGEDPDLSMSLWEHAYQTTFYQGIAVYHKRRTKLWKFSKQVYQFGVARPILNQRHPLYTKITFWFPSIFTLGYAIGIIHYFFEGNGLILILYGLYTLIVFAHASWLHRNISIGGLAIVTTYIQMFSYGYGFLESWLKINIGKQNAKKAFPGHFYE
ncbi:glycosyltransferase [Elizabethkingia argentiflava]|uniref:Glycosyltransferase n=1 Tax=Elizabethkingia argenteiflava TaxID=2681556 RepID=A0A845PYG4_9FLAO|nr:glycosyltransferase [Elizabethkingia argenteiflava]NAW51856.1 glycosyltransferase [Elizabethkingia argenteiflava]